MKALKNKWEAAGKDKENLEELGLHILLRHCVLSQVSLFDLLPVY